MLRNSAAIHVHSLLLAGACAILASASPVLAGSEGGGGFLLMPGAQRVNLAPLDSALEDNGLSDFGDADPEKTVLPTMGGAIFGYRAGLLWAIEGHGFLPKTSKGADDVSTTFSGWYAMLNLGPAYSTDKGFIFSPGIGLGGGGLNMKFERTTTVSDVLPTGEVITDEETAEPEIDNKRNLHASFGMGTAHCDVLWGRSDGGIAFGLRGGYAYSLDGATWRTSDNERVADLPDPNVRGPFVRLSIGLGKF